MSQRPTSNEFVVPWIIKISHAFMFPRAWVSGSFLAGWAGRMVCQTLSKLVSIWVKVNQNESYYMSQKIVLI